MRYHLMRGLWAGSWSVKKGVRKSVGKFEEGWCGGKRNPSLAAFMLLPNMYPHKCTIY